MLDIVTQDVGLISSVVYGLVWRHCQMKDGVCKKNAAELAEMLAVEEKTIRRHLKKLCDAGYIRDLTPELRNRPHIYADAGKVKISGKVEVLLSDDDLSRLDFKSKQNEVTRTLSPTRLDFKSNPLGLKVQPARTLSPMSNTVIPSEENVLSETRAHTPNEILTENKSLGLRLTKLCGYSDPQFVVNSKLKDLADAVTKLAGWNVTVEQLDQFGRYWWGSNPPTFKQVVEEWGKFLASQSAVSNREPTAAPPLDDAKRAAYAAMLAADQQAAAESAARVGEIMSNPTAGGVDVRQELKRVARRLK